MPGADEERTAGIAPVEKNLCAFSFRSGCYRFDT